MSRAPPQRHWRSYGNDPLPTGAEALDEPFAAFPSWFMRVTCERCGQERMFNEAHSGQRKMLIRDIIEKMRHDGCGGRAEKVELLSGIEGVAAGRCGGSCYGRAELREAAELERPRCTGSGGAVPDRTDAVVRVWYWRPRLHHRGRSASLCNHRRAVCPTASGSFWRYWR